MPKVLVIEDEELLLDFLADSLRRMGFDVLAAHDGSSGIDMAKTENPDIIISDINMPVMNGLQVLEKLQEDPTTSDIPFIFLTGKVEMEDLRTGMRLGADDYLVKPVELQELVAAINTRLEKHEKMTQYYKSEINRTKQSLEMTINYDMITGLPKTAMLEKRINEIKEKEKPEKMLALMVLKLDRLRGILDVFGKKDYDFILKLIVERIVEVLPDGQSLYVLENDQFGALLVESAEVYDVNEIAENILQSIRRIIRFQTQELHLTASMGVALSTVGECDFDELYDEAELALNYAIEQGHNNYQIYKQAIKKHVFERLQLENALHRAMDQNEFILVYQPKYLLKDDSIIGVEALVRWENREFGTVSPSQFIPIAEANGLFVRLGEWITETICKQVVEWRSRGFQVPRVAINVSGVQIRDKNFVNSISGIISNSGITGDDLEFELTESILIKNSRETAEKLMTFKNLGVNIAIDDFGTGYSSLQYLKNFPHDKIKIDQSFIRDMTSDKNSASIVTTIISMAHKLGVKVVAEGVESREQVEFLRRHSCDEIQGYYYSKPMPAENLSDFMMQ
jgi:diguanylate cyclase (GGDEF)-like protein